MEMEPHVVVSWCFSHFRLDFVFLNKPFQRSKVMLTLSMFGSITLIFVQKKKIFCCLQHASKNPESKVCVDPFCQRKDSAGHQFNTRLENVFVIGQEVEE